MKKTMPIRTFAIALFCVSILSGTLLLGCASAPKQESTGQYIDSSVITARVKSRLLADEHVKALDISVTTYKNTVVLSGFVDTNAQARRAGQLARSVEGVSFVQNELLVKRR